MNSIERVIYDFIKKNPKLKNFIRDVYQTTLAFIPKKKLETGYDIELNQGYFFGFHDKSPWSSDDSKLLAHRVEKGSSPDVAIGFFEVGKPSGFVELDRTDAWNWQQGSMLQWVGDKNQLIFNCLRNDSAVAKIMDASGSFIKELSRPVGCVDPNGEYVLSYSFHRLGIGMPGYGYEHSVKTIEETEAPENDGVWIINLKDNTEKLLFNLSDLKQLEPEETMKDAFHFCTHCLFSPEGKRFFFLHRWHIKGRRLWTRLISCDVDGGNIHVFPTDGMVSHMTWVGNNQVLAYCNTKEQGDGYYLLDDLRDSYSKIGQNQYASDGHPQYSQENGLVVTDTYPDRFRIQELSTFDIKKHEKKVIARLRAPLKYKNEYRCDLHPRWNHKGDTICFDSVHTGVRSLCTVKVK